MGEDRLKMVQKRAKTKRSNNGAKKKGQKGTKGDKNVSKIIETFIKLLKNTQKPLRTLIDTPTYCTLS